MTVWSAGVTTSTGRRLGLSLQRSQGHRRRRVAAIGSSSAAERFNAQLAQLVEHQEAVLLVADDHGAPDVDIVAGKLCKACHGLLEQAGIAMQHQELLRVRRATAATARAVPPAMMTGMRPRRYVIRPKP